MRVRQLRTYDLPDVGDHLIHFTGRNGQRMAVGPEILLLSPADRLMRILVEGRIRAFPTFGTSGAAIVALTESTQPTVRKVIADGPHVPFGIGFSKQTVFEKNGGPVLYVRGDEWEDARSALPVPLRSRLVRFWPGADADDDEELPDHLAAESQWLHEREWRVPGDLSFNWDEVAFLIVPTLDWQAMHTQQIELWAGEQYASWFRSIPAVVIDFGGNVIHDGSGIWTA